MKNFFDRGGAIVKKIAFNKLKEKYYKKNVVITTYDDKKIVGKYDSEITNLGIIYIGNEEILIKDIKEIELLKDNQIYKYVVVVYEDDELNISKWLSKESLHNAVINALNNEGFKSYYNYDYTDGAYVKIAWD